MKHLKTYKIFEKNSDFPYSIEEVEDHFIELEDEGYKILIDEVFYSISQNQIFGTSGIDSTTTLPDLHRGYVVHIGFPEDNFNKSNFEECGNKSFSFIKQAAKRLKMEYYQYDSGYSGRSWVLVSNKEINK